MTGHHYTYILASKRNGALYIGVTTDLVERVLDHKCNMIAGITSQYAIHQLVYYECHENEGSALLREQAIRQMHRIWKRDLIEQHNPEWRDLYPEITESGSLPASSVISTHSVTSAHSVIPTNSVIPANAGIQTNEIPPTTRLNSGLRRSDGS